MAAPSLASFPRRHAVLTALVAALILLVVLFDWNWLRHPLERYISDKTQRTFTISDLHVRLGLTPTIRMRDVYFSNTDWSKEDAMARIETLEFSVSLRDLPEKILIPRVALTKPDLIFERLQDQRRNWTFKAPSETQEPSKLRIGTLSVDQGRLRFLDHGQRFNIDVQAETFDPAQQERVKDADAKPENKRYATRYNFKGNYQGASFSGQALSGEVLSFQESGVPFPLKGELVAGSTKLSVEGTIADAANISAIDTQLKIQGQTLANLYPFLLLPLPASPPYTLQGHLVLEGKRYRMDNLNGKIGSTDVRGSAAYVDQQPRPLLSADLRSNNLQLADLGPLIGVQTKNSGGKPPLTQAQTNTKTAATAAAAGRIDPSHVLPAGTFDGSRLQKIDADVSLVASKLLVPKETIDLPLESMNAALHLRDGVLKLSPLDFGFAGGKMTAEITLDARKPVIHTDAKIDFRGIRVDRLTPADSRLAQGAGLVGASLQIAGRGNSIADAAAHANGRISAAISNGRVSNLLDAASGLNGGKVLQLLAGGDKTITVNCGGLAFDIADGIGKSKLFVVDTEQTQILGEGGFNLKDESFDITLTPRPKSVGILSLRTPVRLYGRFNQADYELHKGPLLARAGGAVALFTLTPIAALLPLIETGPGEDSDCRRLQASAGVKEAEKQALTKPSSKKKAGAK
ncbi:AsmA family protein [Variovorax sp. HJSM1_2]|uniref:AsmA family protein n=1 Tax=Variovorax sp. HJSM1_2 TaxID=3366263 RepID=UPI003BC77FE9